MRPRGDTMSVSECVHTRSLKHPHVGTRTLSFRHTLAHDYAHIRLTDISQPTSQTHSPSTIHVPDPLPKTQPHTVRASGEAAVCDHRDVVAEARAHDGARGGDCENAKCCASGEEREKSCTAGSRAPI